MKKPSFSTSNYLLNKINIKEIFSIKNIQIKIHYSVIQVILCFLISINAAGQVYYSEGFENRIFPPDNTTLPAGWSQSYVSGTVNWEFEDGGHTKYPEYPYTRKPYPAHSGSYNALFQKESFSHQSTKLITPAINISFSSKPMLVFWHAQASRYFFNNWTNDELRVYYRTNTYSSWILLQEYTSATEEWTERDIPLPADAKSSTLYLAFEGRSMPGWGTCVDDISIIETDTIPKVVNSITATTPPIANAGQGADNILLMRFDIAVKGNQGNLVFDTLNVNYTGTNPADIKTNGLCLYRTSDSTFINYSLLKRMSLSGSSATITLHDTLQPGITFYWLAVDLKSTATVGNNLDFKIPASGIRISKKGYPSTALDPENNCQVVRTIFYDGFETNKGWNLTQDFEINTPFKKGGGHGNPDPAAAYGGTKVLGNDLTSDGDYELNQPIAIATSPTFNCKYFKNVKLQFKRWLNTFISDNASIEISNNDGLTWNSIFSSYNYVVDKQWQNMEYNISSIADKSEKVKVRYTLGPTNSVWKFSGWNIDNLLFYGDTIIYDAAVKQIIAPTDGCGHTSADTVKVWLKNEGSAPTLPSIPLAFSIDNGTTWQKDTVKTVIPVGDSILFTFKPKANLSASGNIKITIKINWALDNYSNNDTLSKVIIAIPTYEIPFTDMFENNYGYWHTGGDNNSWEWGTPVNDSINSAHSGMKVWKTNIFGYYNDNENSYVESPCFHINDTSKVILDLWYNKMIESGDGVAVYYTIDNGNTWQVIPNHAYSWKWNWYNHNYISILGNAGWDSLKGKWVDGKQVIPQALLNQPEVRFRIVLKSDAYTNNEGFAFDDFSLYKAPLNIKINSITSHSSACEGTLPKKISFSITNNGIRTLIPSNDKIIAAFQLNANTPVIDTITLPANLPVSQSVTLTFNKALGVLTGGDYSLKVYHIDPNKGFYPISDNDTVNISFTVYSAPVSGLKSEYATARLDTFTITANNVSNCNYKWANAVNPNLSTNRILSKPPSGYIWLTMKYTTDSLCEHTDTLYMRKLVPDLGITEFKQPTDQCEFPAPLYMKVVVKNFGTDTLNNNDTIKVVYIDHLSNLYMDTVVLTHKLYPNDTIEHLCKKNLLNLSAMHQTYNLKAYTVYKYDSIHTNDTLSKAIHSWGYPTVDLGADHTSAGYDTLRLNGYKTYLWSDGSTDSVYVARYRGYHKVIVTDIHDCPATDSVNINVAAHDIKPLEWILPQTSCSLSNAEQLSVKIKNIGTDTIIVGEKLNIDYSINNGTLLHDAITFTSDIHPYDTITFHFINPYDFSAIGQYNIKVITRLPGDIDRTNDTLYKTIYNYGYPIVDIGPDRTVKALSDTLDAGYGVNWAYTWHDNSHNRKIVLTNTVYAKVTVTDTVTHCATKDSALITFEIRNGSITSTNIPIEFCQGAIDQVEVEFTNVGNINIPQNEKILLGYKINNISYAPDTITLSNILTPGAKILHSFTGMKEKLPVGSDIVKFYCKLNNDIQISNDTLTKNITIHPTPHVDFGDINDTIITTPPYLLQAPEGTGYTYTWTPTHSGSSYSVTTNGWYSVKVQTPFGCADSSRVYVLIFIPDGGITSVLSVSSACKDQFDNATVVFQNLGNTIIPAGSKIPVFCKVGNKSEIKDTITLKRNLLPPQGITPGDTVKHTFRGLSAKVGVGLNHIKYYAKYIEDIYPSNDTAYANVTIYALPSINLEGGQDTVYYFPESTLSANTGTGYYYLWNTGDTTEQITINNDGLYKVKVTNKTTGCSNSDSIYVFITNYDIRVSNVDLPSEICYRSIDSVTVELTNVGNIAYDAGKSFQVIYLTDNGKMAYTTKILTRKLNPGEKFSVKIGKLKDNLTSGNYSIKFYFSVFPELNPSNDTLKKVINVVDIPHINFGAINDTVTGYPGLVLNTGLNKSYYTFLWNNGKTSDTIHVTNSGYYWVRVVSTTTSCTNADTVYARVRIPDGSITSVSGIQNICSNSLNTLNVTIKNSGNESIAKSTMIRIGIKNENRTILIDTSYLSSPLVVNESRILAINSISGKLYLSNPQMKVFLMLPEDIIASNDTFIYNSNLLPSYKREITAQICNGESYTLPSGLQVTTAGTYTSNMITSMGCDSIIITHLTVNPIPQFHLADGSPEKTILFPYTITINFENGENQNDYNYLWNDNSTNKDHIVDFAGNYSVTVSNKNTGCNNSKSIILNQLEEYDLAIDDLVDYSANSCGETPNKLTAIVKNMGNTYIPKESNIIIVLTVNSHSVATRTIHLTDNFLKNDTIKYPFGNITPYLSTGGNTVKVGLNLTKDIQSNNDAKTTTITLLTAPTIDLENGKDTITYSTATYTLDAGVGYDTYLWNTGSEARFLVVSNPGKYWVEISKNGCSASDTIYVLKENNILDKDIDKIIALFPVPASEKVNLMAKGLILNNPTIEIHTSEGRLCYKKVIDGIYNNFFQTISISEWDKGTYIIKLYDSKQIYYKILIIQ
jgi:hypothetical protein